MTIAAGCAGIRNPTQASASLPEPVLTSGVTPIFLADLEEKTLHDLIRAASPDPLPDSILEATTAEAARFFRSTPGPGQKSVIEGLLLSAAATWLVDTLAPRTAKAIATAAKRLWPDRRDLYERSLSAERVFDEHFFALTRVGVAAPENAGQEPARLGLTPRFAGFLFTTVSEFEGVRHTEAICLVLVRHGQTDPRFIQVAPVLWAVRRAPGALPASPDKAGKSALAVELNFEVRGYAQTEAAGVQEIPLVNVNLLDVLEIDTPPAGSVGAATATLASEPVLHCTIVPAPADGGPFHAAPSFEIGTSAERRLALVAADEEEPTDTTRALVRRRPGVVTPSGRTSASPTPGGADDGASVRLYSDPFVVQLRVTERTPQFKSRSVFQEWYHAYVDAFEGTLTRAAKAHIQKTFPGDT